MVGCCFSGDVIDFFHLGDSRQTCTACKGEEQLTEEVEMSQHYQEHANLQGSLQDNHRDDCKLLHGYPDWL